MVCLLMPVHLLPFSFRTWRSTSGNCFRKISANLYLEPTASVKVEGHTATEVKGLFMEACARVMSEPRFEDWDFMIKCVVLQGSL